MSGIVVLTATRYDLRYLRRRRQPHDIGDLSGVAGTEVVLGAHTLTVGAGNVMTFAGVITDVVGGTSRGGSPDQGRRQQANPHAAAGLHGATTITGGTLALTGLGNLFLSSGVTVASGATFDVSGAGTSYNPIRNLAGAGTVELGSNGLTVMSASSEFSGEINGTTAATLELRNGTLTLSGVSTYGGGHADPSGGDAGAEGHRLIASSLYVEFLPNTSGRAIIDIAPTTSRRDGRRPTRRERRWCRSAR